ncbi:hypothetical protein ISN44_As12g020990 [Arabidopsis suecica]|uniref:Uncharacterized protein n=1 Tax=Arabidopsis suecica TaxID=45249 RepID=A0A8T1YKL6_ARASU|nr:hypothetical protein ISN44_As12g020990 [Arabidopsis suecica]
MEDDSFHCENCSDELVMECNKRTSQEVLVDGSDNARRRRDHLKHLLQNMELRLKPLMDHINRIKDLPVPSFESFPAWEARAAKYARENGDLNPDDLIKKGMNLTGEAVELSDDKKSTLGNGVDDKELKNDYNKGYLAAKLEQQELAEKLNQQESAGQSTTTSDIELATTSSDRQGMKCKREEEDEEDVAWEETFNVSANGNYKVDMNVEAEKAEERDF